MHHASTSRIQIWSRIALAWAGVLLCLTPLAAEDTAGIEITSKVNPATIRTGASARYTIDITRTHSGNFDRQSTPNGVVPDVDGLDINYLGQSTSSRTTYSNITGTTRTVTLTLNYQVTPRESGTFSIPAFPLLFEGEEYRVPAAELTVLDAGDDPADADTTPLFMLELLLPDEPVYVGQTLKANLQLYVLDRIPNVRTDYPSKIGDAWAEGVMADNQTRSRGTIGDHEYDVYSRPLLLTPLKAGKQDLHYEMTVQALLPESGSFDDDDTSRDPNSPFNDPFFRQFNLRMNPRMQYQNRQVQSERITVDVQPLPAEGRPPAFSGAIGEFSLKAFPGTNSVRVGDPVTLRLQVAGQGNFDRILPPVLDFGPAWKAYDPETSFRQGDALGFSGVKNFDYTLIPLRKDITHIPEISIAYFDPRTEDYEVLTTGEIPLTVRENPNLDTSQTPDMAGDTAPADEDLEPGFELELDPGRLRTIASTPWITSPVFIGSQVIPALALAGFVLIRRRRIRNERDLARRRRREADARLQQIRSDIGQAVREEDAAQLYRLFFQSIRLVLSKRFGPRAEAATREDLQPLLDQCALDPALHQAVESIFQEGERIAFAHQPPAQSDLLQTRNQWEQTLNQLDHAITTTTNKKQETNNQQPITNNH